MIPDVIALAKLNPAIFQIGYNAHPQMKMAVNQVGAPISAVGIAWCEACISRKGQA